MSIPRTIRLSLTRTHALRRSMQALIDGKGSVDKSAREVFSSDHPIFWAPFDLVGDGGSWAADS